MTTAPPRSGPLLCPALFFLSWIPRTRNGRVETHGPLGTLWAGLALGGFYLALIWVNLLLGHMLTPLFLIPLTWLQDRVRRRKPGAS